MSIFYGALLGDAHAEQRANGKGTRISFFQAANHSEYLLWLHALIAKLGYCNSIIPIIQTRLGGKGILHYVIRFHSFTYASLNSLHEA
jgi:ubiquinol-cytochrome c reductase cytochrome b subunit